MSTPTKYPRSLTEEAERKRQLRAARCARGEHSDARVQLVFGGAPPPVNCEYCGAPL